MPNPTANQPEPGITNFLRDRIAAGDFPSAVYLVAERGAPVFAEAIGNSVLQPETHAATLETIYDLASLTKPLVTGMLCARLLERRQLELDGSVAEYLPQFDRPDKRSITIRQLLTHSSGLPAWRPLYLLASTKEEALAAIAAQPLEYNPGERVLYSDLGFITLGFLVQRLEGHSLPGLARREIFDSLKLQKTFFNPELAMRTGIAACENGNTYERDMCEHQPVHDAGTFATYSGWRSGVIWGEVHDGNANFLGGAAGHAGLFSNATETLRLANQFIARQSELLSAQTCNLFQENLTEGLNEARSFAWQLAATKDSTAGAGLPGKAFGHTGFTGTSCWVDAERERVFILLTNRTHQRPLPFANINSVRREFHALAVAALTNQQKA